MISHRLTDEQRELVEQNTLLVPYAIRRYFGHDAACDEDVIQTGYLGLCQAALSYRPDVGKFSTYATHCIINVVSNEFRKGTTKGRKCSDTITSLNLPLDQDDSGSMELMDIVPDTTQDVESFVINRILFEAALPHVPTLARMFSEGLNACDIARQERKTKCAIYHRIERECRRARAVLGLDPIPA